MFSTQIENCRDCFFCYDCIGCHDCIACAGLRNKKYCIWNKQYSKEEFQQKKKELHLQSRQSLSELHAQFQEFVATMPKKYFVGKSIENASGDYLEYVKNAQECYNCRSSEEVAYITDAWYLQNCQDLTETIKDRWCLQLEGSTENHSSLFCKKVDQITSSLYCSHSYFSNHLFGCVGLRSTEYCILNRKYSKAEYEELVPRIIEHMKSTGEWGEYFPHQLSFFDYNETVAQEYFPETPESVSRFGMKWKSEDDQFSSEEKKNAMSSAHLPDTIHEVNDDMLHQIFICKQSQKPYRIIKAELDFYRKMNLPLPDLHPDLRHQQRMNKRNPRKLYLRQCAKTGVDIWTTYEPSRLEQILCEEAYQSEIY